MAIMKIEAGAFQIGQIRYPTSNIVQQDVNVKEDLNIDDDDTIKQVFGIPDPISRIRQAEFVFDTGWIVSIIWGTAAMCENTNAGLMNDEEFKEAVETVEIGLFHGEHDMYINPDDMTIRQGMWVEGHADSERVREILFFAATLDDPDDPAIMDAMEPEEPMELIDEDAEDLPDEDF